MPGRTLTLTWEHEPRLHAPAKYRKACRYEAYIPDPLLNLALRFSAEAAGIAAEAETAIRDLNADARPALAPLARLLLRTESIASSKVEGMRDERARPRTCRSTHGRREQGRFDRSRGNGQHTTQWNSRSMKPAGQVWLHARQHPGYPPQIDGASPQRTDRRENSGPSRTGSVEMTTIHAAPISCLRLPNTLNRWWMTYALTSTTTCILHSSKRRWPMPSSRPSTPLTTGTDARGEPSSTSFCVAEA